MLLRNLLKDGIDIVGDDSTRLSTGRSGPYFKGRFAFSVIGFNYSIFPGIFVPKMKGMNRARIG